MDIKKFGMVGIALAVVLSVLVCAVAVPASAQSSDIGNMTGEMVDALMALWPLIIFLAVLGIVLGILKKFTTILGAFTVAGLAGAVSIYALSVLTPLASAQSSDIGNMTGEMVDALMALWPLIIFLAVLGIVLGILKKFTSILG